MIVMLLWLRRRVQSSPPPLNVSSRLELPWIGASSGSLNLEGFHKNHHPSLLFISKVHSASSVKVNSIFSKLGFKNFEFVPSEGRFGGLILCWKCNLDVKVVVANRFLISVLVFSSPIDSPW